VTQEDTVFGPDDSMVIVQGSREIPSQTYVDLYTRWRLPLREQDVTLGFGAINIFDEAPPRETIYAASAVTGPSYSRYGDPRQRRFELVVSSHF
jgi:iron complex outermembrane recepter protein